MEFLSSVAEMTERRWEGNVLEIRTAKEEELEKVMSFYDAMIDGMQNAESKPGWKKGVYPEEKFLKGAIERQELLIGILDGVITGAMVVNHESADGYDTIEWKTAAEPQEVTVIHALGVLPEHQGKGLAGEMVNEVIRRAGAACQKALRLDVLAANVSAQKFYLSMGFEYRGTVKLFYEDTGLTEFLLYEYVL